MLVRGERDSLLRCLNERRSIGTLPPAETERIVTVVARGSQQHGLRLLVHSQLVAHFNRSSFRQLGYLLPAFDHLVASFDYHAGALSTAGTRTKNEFGRAGGTALPGQGQVSTAAPEIVPGGASGII